MTDAVNRFFNAIQEAKSESQANLVALFVYYLTVEDDRDVVSVKDVSNCFAACDLTTPSNVAARLSEGLKSKPQKYVKQNGGYKPIYSKPWFPSQSGATDRPGIHAGRWRGRIAFRLAVRDRAEV